MLIRSGILPIISLALKVLSKFCPTLFISNPQKVKKTVNNPSLIRVSKGKTIHYYKLLAYSAITITVLLWLQILLSKTKSLRIILDGVLWAMMYTGHLAPVVEHLRQRHELSKLCNSFIAFETRHRGNLKIIAKHV